MAEEKDELELELENNEDGKIKRIKQLSQKFAGSEREKEELSEKLRIAESEKATLSKEKEFLTSFTDHAIKYPSAKEHQDEIKQKVMAGYSVEDAVVAVLAKNNKLRTADESDRDATRNSALGGSAPTNINKPVEKRLEEMTREEKRSALLEAEERGDLRFEGGRIIARNR